MKNKRICEISGFTVFPLFTYPLFLESSDFIGLSDYVFYDFHNNFPSFKIQFLRQLEKPYNQALLFSVLLCFIVLSFWLLFCWFLFKFQYAVNRIVKGHVLYCNLPSFEMRFAVFWNVGSPYLLNCLIFNDIRFNVFSLPIFLFFVKDFVHGVFVNHSEIGSSAVLLDKDKMLIFKYLYYLVCS